jgi:hypothetical protein
MFLAPGRQLGRVRADAELEKRASSSSRSVDGLMQTWWKSPHQR